MFPDYFLLPVALILLIAAAISMEKRGDSKTNSWMHTFGCWTAIIVAIWLLAWWGFHYVYNNNYISTWLRPNEFGDMFGALTCLFSGIAIAGVIAMLRQQHEEMKETRKEFSEQTKQFEEQTKQFNEQIELARQAQIRDDFYRRIEIFKHLEDSISFTASSNEKGIEAISQYYLQNMLMLKYIAFASNNLAEEIKSLKTHSDTLLSWIRMAVEIAIDFDLKTNITFNKTFYSLISPQGKSLIILISPVVKQIQTENFFQWAELPEDFLEELQHEDRIDYYRAIMQIMLHQYLSPHCRKRKITQWISGNPPPHD